MSQAPHVETCELADLALTPEAVGRVWGDPSVDSFRPFVVEMLATAADHADVRAGYVRVADVTVDEGSIRAGSVRLRPGPIVTGQLEGVDSLDVLVATLGERFDRFARGLFDGDDPVRGYLADAIGSVAVEAAADRIEARIDAAAARKGRGATRRLSPGYCGWPVAEQRALFSLLPDGFCGVRLNASAFMSPVKSVSAIVGSGASMVKAPYPCATCDRDECHRRGDR